MRRSTKAMVVLAVLALAMTAVAAPAAADGRGRARGHPVYLALGDSWAYGQGAADPTVGGYVVALTDDLREELDCHPAPWRDSCRRLRLKTWAARRPTLCPG